MSFCYLLLQGFLWGLYSNPPTPADSSALLPLPWTPQQNWLAPPPRKAGGSLRDALCLLRIWPAPPSTPSTKMAPQPLCLSAALLAVEEKGGRGCGGDQAAGRPGEAGRGPQRAAPTPRLANRSSRAYPPLTSSSGDFPRGGCLATGRTPSQ